MDRDATPPSEPIDATPLTVVVMAKAPQPGRVKTRLIHDGLTPQQAADVHTAMARCVTARLNEHLAATPRVPPTPPPHATRRVLAIAGPPPDNPDAQRDAARHLGADPDAGWIVIDQGHGDLGQRMTRLWQHLTHAPHADVSQPSPADAPAPLAFFGIDSPDLPADALHQLARLLRQPDTSAPTLVLGPSEDGGYWTLAATHPRPAVLHDIDWGTDRVLAQTRDRAEATATPVAYLTQWQDVDDLVDLNALRQRLASTTDPALLTLRADLDTALVASPQSDPAR